MISLHRRCFGTPHRRCASSQRVAGPYLSKEAIPPIHWACKCFIIRHGIYILLAGKLFNLVKNIFFIQKHLKYGDLNIRIPIPIHISFRSNLLLSHIDEKLIAKKCRICVGLLVLFVS